MSDLSVSATLRDIERNSTMGSWISRGEKPPNLQERQTITLPTNVQVVDRQKTKECLSKLTEALIFERSKVNQEVQQEADRRILDAFLQEVKNAKSQGQQNWSALQHYVYFIYRHAISTTPAKSREIFPGVVYKRARELVEKLIAVDKPQMFIRLETQLREYSLITRKHLEARDSEPIISFLGGILAYYSAFCSAANKLAPLIPEFEDLISSRFGVNWIALNKSVFYHYIYLSTIVQRKLPFFETFKNSDPTQFKHRVLVESYMCFVEDMQQVATRWTALKRKISSLRLSQDKVHNPGGRTTGGLLEDWEMYKEQLSIMKSNAWITRSPTQIKLQDMSMLDAQLLSLIGDTKYVAEFLIDNNGRCMCEDCMSAQLRKYGLMTPPLSPDYQVEDAEESRLHVDCLNTAAPDDITIKKVLGTSPAKVGKAAAKTMPVVVKEKVKEQPTKGTAKKINKQSHNVAAKDKQTKPQAAQQQQQQQQTQQQQQQQQPPPQGNHKEREPKDRCQTEPKLCKTNPPSVAGPNPTSLAVAGPSAAVNKTVDTNGQKPMPCQGHACGHKCKAEENQLPCVYDSKNITACQHEGSCNDDKDVKKCDCTYCESPLNTVKLNETRDRLRSRLNQRLIPIENAVDPQSPTNSSISSMLVQDNNDKRDIKDLLNFIEGNKTAEKEGKAQKKAAKKARRKEKKLKEEEEKAMEEKRLLEELRKLEEQAKAEELAKAEALAKAEEDKLKRAIKQVKGSKQKKKLKHQHNANNSDRKKAPSEIEQTIPAMVTIKRVVENTNEPPKVTITLKGSTPDEDKLLYTLVNGQSHEIINGPKSTDKKSRNKAKKLKEQMNPKTVHVGDGKNSNSVKVTVQINEKKSPPPPATNKSKKITKTTQLPPPQPQIMHSKEAINLSLLRLPPGITITKVSGPPVTRKINSAPAVTNIVSNDAAPKNSSASGVIVVDTEKLIKQLPVRKMLTPPMVVGATGKKNKKKNKKKQDPLQNKPVKMGSETRPKYSNTVLDSQPKMITLKNPIFHGLSTGHAANAGNQQTASSMKNKNTTRDMFNIHGTRQMPDLAQQASIIKNDNGMVTIRSPRLQQSLDMQQNVVGIPNQTAAAPSTQTQTLKPVASECHPSCYQAHDILVGLPGIEITKVDKFAAKFNSETRRAFEQADVSIIPTNNGVLSGTPKALQEIDWSFDSDGVFLPKDILEDDLDADERELELFKRFCHQSVPPERKEKVAHLNVKDIVLKKREL